ncbi:MAG: ATP-binding protein, partial [Bacteroidota bacterium]
FLFIAERYNHLDLYFSYFPEILNYYEREINILHVIFYLFFFWSFLEELLENNKLTKLIYVAFFIYALISLYNLSSKFFLGDPYYIERNLIPNIISGLFLSAISIYATLKIEAKEAKLIGLGFLFYVVGMWTTIYYYFGAIFQPSFASIENPHIYYQLGILGELFCFALAIGYRNNQIIQQKENEKIHWQSINQLNQTKAKLYTNITHEFRTPLTVILGLTDQINQQPKYKLTERVQIIRKNGQQLLKLVNELMDMTQLDAGEIKLHYLQADVIAFLGYLTDSFKNLAQTKKIHLTFFSEMPSLLVDFEEKKLQQVMVNLLHNAIKFTPEHGEITVAVTQIEDRLQIKIKDSGIGISATEQTQIFGRFYQVNDSSVRENEGSGIGLAIVKELVELMEGTIELESKPNWGSIFTLNFPISNNAPVLTEKIQIEAPNLTSPSPQMVNQQIDQKYTTQPLILLVEDNPDVLYFLKSCLDQDYETMIAPNGAAGLQMALELLPNLIITDIMMPKMDGFELTKQLKKQERTKHIPILIITAKATQTDRLRGLELGAAAYLFKPFDRKELLLQVANTIHQEGKQNRIIAGKTNTKDIEFLEKLYQIIDKNLDKETFQTSDLAKALAISRTQLFRTLKESINQTPSNLIRKIRIERAKKLLQNSNLNIGEIATKTGFKDQSYFTKVFTKEVQQSPSEFRKHKNNN